MNFLTTKNKFVTPPADWRTHIWRNEAHELFDKLWKSGVLTREQAYTWMRERFRISREDAHIRKFSEEQCRQLVSWLYEDWEILAMGEWKKRRFG